MTLFEALMHNGTARSGDGKVVVVRRGWENAYARGEYYALFRNGYRAGTYKTLLDVLHAADVETMDWHRGDKN